MEQGSLTEQHLDAAILKQLKKKEKDWVLSGIGNDYSRVDNMVTADGTGETPQEAWDRACNNFSCSGGMAKYARLLLLYPKSAKESHIKAAQKIFVELAEQQEITIVGGQTQIWEPIEKPFYSVTLFGEAGDYHAEKKQIQAGDSIVMIGYAGMQGTKRLVREYRQILEQKFAPGFLDSLIETEGLHHMETIKTFEKTMLYSEVGIRYMHDVSNGGIYTALWQLGRWCDRGFVVENAKIPIRQETIEICEVLDCNPYLLDGTGALLLVCEKGKKLTKTLEEYGIASVCIGKMTEDKERLVSYGRGEYRTLAPAEEDAIYRIGIGK